MKKPTTDLNGHPCVPHPRDTNRWICQRCRRDTAWNTATCAPGMTVHLPPTTASDHHDGARRHWLSLGCNVTTEATTHRYYRTCTECYDPETDPKRQPIYTPAQMPGAGYERLGPTTPPGTAVHHDGYAATILWSIDWPPDTHTGYAHAIPAHWWARQVVTTHGSAWYGHPTGQHYRPSNTTGDGISFAHHQSEPRLCPAEHSTPHTSRTYCSPVPGTAPTRLHSTRKPLCPPQPNTTRSDPSATAPGTAASDNANDRHTRRSGSLNTTCDACKSDAPNRPQRQNGPRHEQDAPRDLLCH